MKARSIYDPSHAAIKCWEQPGVKCIPSNPNRFPNSQTAGICAQRNRSRLFPNPMKKFKDLKPTRVFESLWRFAAERHAI
jgi:hypothetical protein